MTSKMPNPAQTSSMTHVVPFIYEEADSKSLHFTINQLQSRMRTSRPNELQVEYTRTMMGFLLVHRHPQHIALIGLGGGSLAKFCLEMLPEARITAVEINPHVIALRKEFCIPDDNERFKVLQSDGMDFVTQAKHSMDVILVDGYDHTGQPAQLCSLQFYQACKQALTTNGVLVVNLDDSHPLYELFIDRIDRSFEGNFVEVSVNGEGNVIVFAIGNLRLTPDSLRTEIQKVCGDWVQWMSL